VGITGFVLGPVVAALFIAAWEIYELDRAPRSSGSDETEAARAATDVGGL
jgi:hypothetical protein